MTEATVESENPFDIEEALNIQLIVSMRLYDVLMAVLSSLDEDASDVITEAHKAGVLMGYSPKYIGRFLSDEADFSQNSTGE
jgi:hypothetical protein